MKVKVRNENYTHPIVIAFVEFVCLGVPILYFISIFKGAENLVDTVIKSAAVIAFLLIFLILGIIFLIGIIKPPKKYVATLASKKNSTYKGNNICEMSFRIVTNNVSGVSPSYSCYTDEQNNLEIGQRYNIYIKQFGCKIKKIDVNGTPKESNKSHDYVIYDDETKGKKSIQILAIIFISLISVFLLLGIFGLIFYPQYAKYYAGWLGFNVGALYLIIKIFRS